MLWHPLPFPVLILGIADFISSSFRGSRRKPYYRDTCSSPIPKTNRKKVMDMINVYSDHTAEIFNVSIINPVKAEISQKYAPGDEVTLNLIDESVNVVIDGHEVGSLWPLYDSNVSQVLTKRLPHKAFIFDREMEPSHAGLFDFISVIVFYKIDGIPPTKVELKS